MSTQEKHSSAGSISGQLSAERIKELKAKSHVLEPVVWVGKAGITDTVAREARKQIRARGLIKVKFLKAALGEKGKKELAEDIAAKTGSSLVHQVGFVAVLYGKKMNQDRNEEKVFK